MLHEESKGFHVGNWDSPRTSFPMGQGGPMLCLGAPDDPNRPVAVWFSMGHEGGGSPPHAHSGWALTVVLSGSWKVAGIEQSPGEASLAEPNVFYGPFEPGPDGVVGVEIFENMDAVGAIWGEYAEDPRVLALGDYKGEMAIYP